MQHIPACGSLRNLLLTISYDGKKFHGWQIQQNAMTVQEAFQTALSKIIGNDFDVKGCSRTDSGVHANMYCISLKTEHPIKPERLKAALNRWLPLSIAVLDCKEVAPDFHARYSCTSKEYIYKIWNSEVRNPFLDGYALHYRYKIDENLLDKAALVQRTGQILQRFGQLADIGLGIEAYRVCSILFAAVKTSFIAVFINCIQVKVDCGDNPRLMIKQFLYIQVFFIGVLQFRNIIRYFVIEGELLFIVGFHYR